MRKYHLNELNQHNLTRLKGGQENHMVLHETAELSRKKTGQKGYDADDEQCPSLAVDAVYKNQYPVGSGNDGMTSTARHRGLTG